jgi:hypothetical protein
MAGDYGFIITANNQVSAKMREAEGSISHFTAHANTATKEVSEHFEVMGERMTEVFRNLKSLLLTGLGITALFEGWELIENSKVKFEALEKQIVKVNTVLQSTKFAAGFNSQNIQDQSKELSKRIVNSRDEILAAQATLLSNTNIKGDTFKKALQDVADYSTFKGTGLNQGAFIIGRALQDPIQGMNQLRRMGIILSAQQKEHIKNYEKQGQLVKAQSVILDEINKKYGGQAAAYAGTDAGKIQVASKVFTELQYRIGEVISRVEVSLIPSFIHITDALIAAFNSSTIQFFIEHIKDLVTWALRLLPIWAGYKLMMLGVAGVQQLVAFTEAMFTKEIIVNTAAVTGNKFAVAGFGSALVATEEAIVGTSAAMEAFSAAMASTGIGLLVVGIGLLIEKLISVNGEFNASIEKITKLDELTNKANPTLKDASDAYTTFKFGKLDDKQKGILYNTTKQREDIEKSSLSENNTQISAIRAAIADAKKEASKMPDTFGDTENSTPNQEKIELNNKIAALTEQMKGLATVNTTLYTAQITDNQISNSIAKQNDAIIAYNKKYPNHKKPLIISPINSATGGVQGDATNTSLLSGASGGLGTAKVIHISFNGPFQQNNGVKESKSQADEAIEKMTEMLNSFSDSVNAQ